MGGDYKCPECNKSYTRPQHVVRHSRSHTGDKPFKCDLDVACTAAYTRSDLLSRHKRLHHLPASPESSSSSNSSGNAPSFRPLDPARIGRKRKIVDLAPPVNKKAKKIDAAPISKKTDMVVKPKAGGFGFETSGGTLEATKSWTALLEEFEMGAESDEKLEEIVEIDSRPLQNKTNDESVHTWIDNSFSTSPYAYTFPVDGAPDLSSFGSSTTSSRSGVPDFTSSFAAETYDTTYIFSPPVTFAAAPPEFAPAPSSFECTMEAALAQFVAPKIGHAVSRREHDAYPFPQQQQMDFVGALEKQSQNEFKLSLPSKRSKAA